jgi:glyoxalase family protein
MISDWEGESSRVSEGLPGLHHVTAICDDARSNVNFYVGTLGLRLVKRTVNFDDPNTYHLYYGDFLGRPGTVLTFFVWPGAFRGQRGMGQTTAVTLAVPPASISYWQDRLGNANVPMGGIENRFGGAVLPFTDPAGVALELVERVDALGDAAHLWWESPVPMAYGIQRIDGVTLTVTRREPTYRMFQQVLGFTLVDEDGDRLRFTSSDGASGSLVDLCVAPDAPHSSIGVGTVHHVAWCVTDEQRQDGWRQRIVAGGRAVSSVLDREYFRSIYFHEPGGALCEIATEQPGFTVDEPASTLGSRLCLPAWLEPSRRRLEAQLSPLMPPGRSAPVMVAAGGA